jgi:hypothetical protein
MAGQVLPDDFREFLRLLNEADVGYLLVGGYAVGYHGYPRSTADMDIWARIMAEIDGLAVPLISRQHLRLNKRAAGRHKDLDDLEHLPED